MNKEELEHEMLKDALAEMRAVKVCWIIVATGSVVVGILVGVLTMYALLR